MPAAPDLLTLTLECWGCSTALTAVLCLLPECWGSKLKSSHTVSTVHSECLCMPDFVLKCVVFAVHAHEQCKLLLENLKMENLKRK